jgi:hypothetical protein
MPSTELFLTVRVDKKRLTEGVLELYENGKSIEDGIESLVEECIEVVKA